MSMASPLECNSDADCTHRCGSSTVYSSSRSGQGSPVVYGVRARPEDRQFATTRKISSFGSDVSGRIMLAASPAVGRKILVYPMLDDRNVIPDPGRAAPSTASTKPRSRSVVFSLGSL
jgi:hypothetical protein